tara:strand:+ start:1334 stop:1561 length:228 start_codon:yes stop_codon:yes gene_type:complete
MIKLHPETAQAIADLICKIDVARIMARDCPEDSAYWLADRYNGIIELAEKYGIPHSNYDLAVDAMKKDLFANATL